MTRFNPAQNSFVAGELSPRLEGRSDLDQYFQGMRQTKNGIVLPHGGFQRRSGTRFVAEAKTSNTRQVRLIPFVVSVEVSYVVELGHEYARFYLNGVQVLDSNNNPLEITTPFKEDELRDVHFAQSADVMWLVHPFHFPRKLRRTQANPDKFDMVKVQFREGKAPLRRVNNDLENAVIVSGTSSNPRTLTWQTNPTDGGLDSDDVGRAVRLDDGQKVGWYEITNVVNSTQADADLLGGDDPKSGTIDSKANGDPLILQTVEPNHGMIEGEIILFEDPSGNTLIDPASGSGLFIVGPSPEDSNGDIILNQFQVNTFPDDKPVDGSSLTINGDETYFRAPTNWALGMFANNEGPRTVTFHEGRLGYGGSRTELDRLVLSVVEDFDNFELFSEALNNATKADLAIQRRVLSTQVNAIQWMQSADERLFVGTSGGEFMIRGENNDLLTPDGAQVVPMTARGSLHIQPSVIDNQIIMVQRNGTKLRRLGFDVEADGLVATDISVLAEHILDQQVFETAYQQDPDSVFWTLRGDGKLVGWTIESQQQVIGAHQHSLGGQWLGRDAVVESVTVIPAPSGWVQDQIWLSVRRTVNGQTVRYIEFMSPQYKPEEVNQRSTDLELIGALEESVFVDSSLALNNPIGITNITQSNPARVSTSSAHGLAANDTVRIRDVGGMTSVNQRTFTVTNVVDSTTFDIDVDTTGFDPYIAFGTVRKEFGNFSGLDHLEGETVSVLADGAVHPDRTVSNGGITLNRKASIVQVGLRYETLGETQRFIGGAQLGVGQGQQHRIQRIVARLHNTLGGDLGIGSSPEDTETLVFRKANDRMNRAIPLFLGDKEVPVPGGWTDEPTVFFRQSQPLPMTVLALMPRMEVNER